MKTSLERITSPTAPAVVSSADLVGIPFHRDEIRHTGIRFLKFLRVRSTFTAKPLDRCSVAFPDFNSHIS